MFHPAPFFIDNLFFRSSFGMFAFVYIDCLIVGNAIDTIDVSIKVEGEVSSCRDVFAFLHSFLVEANEL